MLVNDNACELDKRGVLESIAGKPAPTGIALSMFPGRDGRRSSTVPFLHQRVATINSRGNGNSTEPSAKAGYACSMAA
ncbi:hypothetical protein CD175_22450 [Pseudomonas laurylsulfatiphila]|uniref:Uncharacterized protein n=1 Tax=Pseudomonas laurylsulfatiphila TaxID=2011015 RepID=A0A2S6FG33_9PSED|nr:hypothetical protein CD175_22450 [Pseudomonas laurylsulfatiphila]